MKNHSEFEDVVDLDSESAPSRGSSDAAAVQKLGFKPTVPRTLDRLIGLIGLNSSVVCPWPSFYFVSVLNLSNGGTAGLLLATIVASLFMGPVYMSLAEKIRKFPTAGGQYHWVAALAPPRCRRFLSFFCCCILTFTWLSYLMAATWLFGLDITAILLIHTGEYHTKWAFIAAVCMSLFAALVNVTWGKHMNYPETLIVVVHIVAFLLLIGLLSFANASGTLHPSFTFTTDTGWSTGVGTVLSIVYVVGVLSGFDCASHVAEDTVDAGNRLPKSLLWSTTANKLSCLIVAILIGLCGGNLNGLVNGKLGASGHPFGVIVQLTFDAARGNKATASAVFGMIAPILMMSCINTCAAASRMVFSFIRDDNNPFFQKLMARDLETEQVPRLAVLFTAITPAMTLWINFLSPVGFSAIVSQVTLSLVTTYMLAIGCSLYSRIYHPEVLGRQRKGLFQLGQLWGSINDTIALLFLAVIWVFAWFPFLVPINAATIDEINYAPIIDCGIAILGILYYILYARKHYQNPAPHEITGLES